MKINRQRFLVSALATALIWLACGSSTQVVTGGKSKTTVTATKPIKYKVKGPITFPKDFPIVGGRSVAAGVEIDISLEPGQSVTLDDKVNTDGKVEITGVARQGAVNRWASRAGGAAAIPVVTPVPVAPPGSLYYTATVQAGSTYTWRVPSWFGSAPAVVAVSGSVAALGAPDAIVDDGNGGWKLRSGGLYSFNYQVSGPPAVWQAPLDTPYGTITGTGTIETSTGMLLQSTADPSGVSGGAVAGYVDPQGQSWSFGYTGAYPVQLTLGDGVAVGVTTIDGGFDAAGNP